MSLLIDGYNLLNATGIVGSGRARTRLEASRRALLNFLAEHLSAAEVARTTVVFDATHAPPGLPRVADYRGMTVRFAARGSDADSLIEELIEAEPDPRHLTVVSSDHRLHRAARRRRARAVDSDVWYEELTRMPPETPPDPAVERPPVPLLAEDVEYWMRQFGEPSTLDAWLTEGTAEEAAEDAEASGDEPAEGADEGEKPGLDELDDIGNPFPPGYGEEEEHES